MKARAEFTLTEARIIQGDHVAVVSPINGPSDPRWDWVHKIVDRLNGEHGLSEQCVLCDDCQREWR